MANENKESRGGGSPILLCQQLALDPCWPALADCVAFTTANCARSWCSGSGLTTNRENPVNFLGTLYCLQQDFRSPRPAGCYRPSPTLRLFLTTPCGAAPIKFADLMGFCSPAPLRCGSIWRWS